MGCSKVITSKYSNKFCSRSCAASWNNSLKPKRIAENKVHKCLNCGRETSNPKYCSRACVGAAQTKLVSLKCPVCTQNFVARRNRKFCSDSCSREARKTVSVRDILFIKQQGKCLICSRKTWNKGPIPLELDHIDGNSENNKERNLRLICPNCHAQTPTYKGRNIGKGRHSRRVRYHEGKSY